DQPVRIRRRTASVGRHLIVQVCLRISPVPLRDDDVPLDTARTWRSRRHLAFRNAIGPIRKQRDRARPELIDATAHAWASLSGLKPPGPGRLGGRERAERRWNFARRLVAELMARPAAAGFHVAQPFGLTANLRRDAVRRGSRKLVLRRNVEQRKPGSGG